MALDAWGKDARNIAMPFCGEPGVCRLCLKDRADGIVHNWIKLSRGDVEVVRRLVMII
ncbi:MAG: hypothetical protein M3O30_02760 [Planctomycetota bacterium]|nr:hypothetical protein [Planctomycetota bacterium]